jgi:hypothetical protein
MLVTSTEDSGTEEEVVAQEREWEEVRPESWLQPPIGLYAPVPRSGGERFQRMYGVTVCSSTVVCLPSANVLRQEMSAWSSLSAEALSKFEERLGD